MGGEAQRNYDLVEALTTSRGENLEGLTPRENHSTYQRITRSFLIQHHYKYEVRKPSNINGTQFRTLMFANNLSITIYFISRSRVL
jgi:hypothetical protein